MIKKASLVIICGEEVVFKPITNGDYYCNNPWGDFIPEIGDTFNLGLTQWEDFSTREKRIEGTKRRFKVVERDIDSMYLGNYTTFTQPKITLIVEEVPLLQKVSI